MKEKKSGGYITSNKPIYKESTFPYFYDSVLTYSKFKKQKQKLNKNYSKNSLEYKVQNLPYNFQKKIVNEIQGPIWFNDSILFFSTINQKNINSVKNLKLNCYYNEEKIPLPFCLDSFSYSHPSFDTKNNRLYFSVKEKGRDANIFYSEFNQKSWSEAKKLNENINTKGNEMFPCVRGNYLYFASNGLPGIGGLDLFEIEIDQINNGVPKNLGRNINSPLDDFSICFKDNHSGYFSSNRNDYTDAIYTFEYDLNTKINHCINACSKTSCISLSHEYTKNANLLTKWVLGNGDTILGQNIKYCYGKKGFYEGELIVFDTLESNLILFQEPFVVKIDDEYLISPEIIIETEGVIEDSLSFFIDNSINENIFAVEWSFGDGNSSQEDSSYYSYSHPGVYQVVCNVFFNDANGLECCKVESIGYINIKDTINNQVEEKNNIAIDYFSLKLELQESLNLDDFKMVIMDKGLSISCLDLTNATAEMEVELNKSKDYRLLLINKNTNDTINRLEISNRLKKENEFSIPHYILMSTVDTLFFDHNSFEIIGSEITKINFICKYLSQNPKVKLKVEGYTDAVGSPNDNLKLSQKRVEEVVNYLKGNGVQNNQIIAKALGERNLIEPCVNCDQDKRRNNRRVELTIIKDE